MQYIIYKNVKRIVNKSIFVKINITLYPIVYRIDKLYFIHLPWHPIFIFHFLILSVLIKKLKNFVILASENSVFYSYIILYVLN